MSTQTRRSFLRNTTNAAIGTGVLAGAAPAVIAKNPNNKLNFAHIGVGGRGGAVFGVSHGHNVVALCDVNDTEVRKRKERLGGEVAAFADYRTMFDKMANEIDAVVIATPDHSHALPALMAIRNGMHVYCEKPLAHSVHECFVLAEAAREEEVKTQMGNQAHSDYQFHRAAELIRAGFIGKVSEVHVNHLHPEEEVFPVKGAPETGPARSPGEGPEIPRGFHWDLWLGGAEVRPYHPTYCPKGWRGWRDFGTGTLGDFFCHHADPAFMALGLKHPITVEAGGTGRPLPADRNPGTTVRWEFPAKDGQPPVTMYWHQNQTGPPAEIVDVDLRSNEYKYLHCLIVGENGALAMGRGAGMKDPVLLPQRKFKGAKLPETNLGKIISHQQELTHRVLHGGQCGSNFEDYASYLTAAALLGHVSYWAGGKIEWDGDRMEVTNHKEANRFVKKTYRKGWEVA